MAGAIECNWQNCSECCETSKYVCENHNKVQLGAIGKNAQNVVTCETSKYVKITKRCNWQKCSECCEMSKYVKITKRCN